MFNKIGIFGKYVGDQCWDNIEALIQFLQSKSKTVFLDDTSCHNFPSQQYNIEIVPRKQLSKKIDLAIVVGGDGTFLDVVRSIVDDEVPILGINLGRLGFLTDISPADMLTKLEEILSGHYQEEQRNLLKVTIYEDDKIIFEERAFNDVVIHKTDSPRMIEFETFVDGRFLNSQRSDGMIISTPTGSTAYALSAGGPILDPDLDAISLVSINPHTMSTRPFVISGDSEVELRPHEECNGTAQIICDGQLTHTISSINRTFVTRNPKYIKMLHPIGHDHFELLRAKLRWGDKL
ncbi:NAD(+) kinase [Thiomicrorhabdus sp. zzn3]|uniref:NAD(+) kinase n=1 Tax=Thiomicrorhabdus sp. zzn3 TaxID=3039775 RepID=UPI002436832B|nr:NAD(+) kinase [Thiomicrorhabdus sp. zzn3]MDG6778230.1 NAD(+) kinase [Thiomicrorhabdus sp. zzn3]